MQQILIKNFGPIVNRQGVPVSFSKVLVLCGEQGTGKSSVAKLISQFSWLEKALVRRTFLFFRFPARIPSGSSAVAFRKASGM